jgi:hypothetical protein
MATAVIGGRLSPSTMPASRNGPTSKVNATSAEKTAAIQVSESATIRWTLVLKPPRDRPRLWSPGSLGRVLAIGVSRRLTWSWRRLIGRLAGQDVPFSR